MAVPAECAAAHDTKHKQAYDVLNGFFRKHKADVVEIEVLPPAIAPPEGCLVLEDGLCIGVPKKLLAAAFVTARTTFFQKRAVQDPDERSRALDATRIMLLFDPEHLTAANFRKQHLLDLQSRLIETSNDESLKQAVHLELYFLDSILTSPLHRQSKSPTLWHHRCWLTRTFGPCVCISRQPNGTGESWQDLYISELGVVMKSGERHPKNYHAWQYGRRLFNKFQGEVLARMSSPKNPSAAVYTFEDSFLQDINKKSIHVVHDWCLRNPSDTSAWSFLLFLLRRPLQEEATADHVVDKTLELAYNFHWRHESIWVFLRSVLAESDLLPETSRRKYVQEIEGKYVKDREASTEAPGTNHATPHPALKALEWIRKNSDT